MLRRQQQAVGQQAGPAQQGALRRNPRQLRKIIAFREMRQDDIGGLAVVVIRRYSAAASLERWPTRESTRCFTARDRGRRAASPDRGWIRAEAGRRP